ncbi:MAG: HRDC domain-containing protein [Victivallales bacterium]|nr:HRDC domain-containing protein [Victivallales bacterium]
MLWIQDDDSLKSYCEEAAKRPIVAVDTEFVWMKTYHPQLGLVQLSYEGGENALIDALAVMDRAPLKALLESPSVTKVFHEAGSDLPILHRWCGALACNVFDTRIAAGFVGMTASLSLKKLLNVLLGVDLAKTETRTDWLQRPLTLRQLEYAACDVKFMPKACELMRGKLEATGNLAWFEEEMRVYSQESHYEEPADELAWNRVSGNNMFSGRQLAILAELACWREKTARAKDIARPRIISDEQMVLAVQYMPKSLGELRYRTGMWPRPIERYGNDILACLERGMQIPEAEFPKHRFIPLDVRILKQRADRVLALIHKRAATRQIDAVLVGSRRDAESLVMATAEKTWPFHHRLLDGWRGELLGDVIVKLVKEKFAK